MKDTLETNLPVEEAGKLETQTSGAVEADNTVDHVNPEMETTTTMGKLSKEDILERLRTAIDAAGDTPRSEIESLKQAYYRLRRSEVEQLKKAFLQQGGEEKDFILPSDPIEDTLKQLLNTYKEARACALAEEERIKQENYALKLRLIDKLKDLSESHEDFNKLYHEFKEIQQQWKEITLVPQEVVNDLWKDYQTYCEMFYDLIKINNQFRDYDFKKNLEMKTALCETVEKLQEEEDIVSAFHQLQKLHQQWREIGPVAKEMREPIWNRFKAASTIINKKHQQHFEGLKAKEQENLKAKTEICEIIEGIQIENLKSYKQWDDKSKEILALQEQWKTIGFAPKKHNVKIFERFRAACDHFFLKKNEFNKQYKAEMEENLALKRALCEKAEAMKDSKEWKSTAEKFIALQKDWKKVGPVSRKHSDAIWKRFISACDYFFEQKEKEENSVKNEEKANLAAKKALIEQVKALHTEEDSEQVLKQLKQLTTEWNAIGHVPFKDKDKVYKAFHSAVDAEYDRLKISRKDRRMQTFRNNLTDMSGKGKGKLYSERDRLLRNYERMKNELQTYENNIGFLSISSKGGNGLMKEMERKITSLKEEMAMIIQKIDLIDENL